MSAAAVAAAAGKLPALPSSVSQMSPVSAAAAAGAAAGPSQLVPHREKKYRPPHKTDKFTPKPIPPELGNLKTYSESTFVYNSRFYIFGSELQLNVSQRFCFNEARKPFECSSLCPPPLPAVAARDLNLNRAAAAHCFKSLLLQIHFSQIAPLKIRTLLLALISQLRG